MNWFVIAACFIFVTCASVYSTDFFYNVDVSVTLFFEKLRLPFLTDVFLVITELGSLKFYLPLCLVIGLYFLFKRKIVGVIFLFVTLYSVRQLNYQLKEVFSRERPSFDAVYEASHYSFPSGHAMNSAAIYGFICFLLVFYIIKEHKKRMTAAVMTAVLVFLIGVSRMYLGVHYLTDVLAGWSVGFIWLVILSTIFAKIHQFIDKNRRY
ncbi:phosphatase PAP2 family protein [Metabacillus litoralis]|uniref:phosphatase PAP2 family protein n=1 Tax=Metabacillus TaxID=2675233 RepID=UPI0013CEAF21|nr:phosphatase PAP2 family protein [Metabacillus litoralis]MCM3410665.1 phosphatase PAP2 family protein [Metabacillus litoralis]UHA58248.1 phosphatase PAP2 family protein [Metabacillus litoralis]